MGQIQINLSYADLERLMFGTAGDNEDKQALQLQFRSQIAAEFVRQHLPAKIEAHPIQESLTKTDAYSRKTITTRLTQSFADQMQAGVETAIAGIIKAEIERVTAGDNAIDKRVARMLKGHINNIHAHIKKSVEHITGEWLAAQVKERFDAAFAAFQSQYGTCVTLPTAGAAQPKRAMNLKDTPNG